MTNGYELLVLLAEAGGVMTYQGNALDQERPESEETLHDESSNDTLDF